MTNVAGCTPPSVPRRTNSSTFGSFRRERRNLRCFSYGNCNGTCRPPTRRFWLITSTTSRRRCRGSGSDFRYVATEIGMLSNVLSETQSVVHLCPQTFSAVRNRRRPNGGCKPSPSGGIMLKLYHRTTLPLVNLLSVRERYQLRYPCLCKFSTNLRSIPAEW